MDNQFFTSVKQGSQFAQQLLDKHIDWSQKLIDQGQHEKAPDLFLWQSEIAEICLRCETEADLMAALRKHRNLTQIGIIGRDFARINSSQQTCEQLSTYADTVIVAAKDWLYQKLVQRYGVPCNKKGEAQMMQVIAMGKLGARELNLSSDIDLIFVFGEHGYTDGEKQIDNERFFSKLAQQLIKVLDQRTADGFVFRVDMRLRPYGQSGALVSNFNAFEEYYLTQGREWERYAMVKARPINGDEQQVAKLDGMLKRFTYRQYTDFGLLESLRDMKRMIQAEVVRRGSDRNIKLGRGGIRELEFIAQAFQLLKGGRVLRMQQRAFNKVMPAIASLGWMDPDLVDQLIDDYWFLRDVEHRIQGWRDEQSQILPADNEGELRIAQLMGYDSVDSFGEQLGQIQERVAQAFDGVIREDQSAQAVNVSPQLVSYWHDLTKTPIDIFTPSTQLTDALHNFKAQRTIANLTGEGEQRLNQLMPLVIAAVAATDDPANAFLSIEPLLMATARRSVYYQLLIDHPWALAQTVKLSMLSPWVGEELTNHPSLLETLADQQLLYQVPKPAEIRDQLRQLVSRVPLEDVEAHMEIMRHYKRSVMMRVAACELIETLPLMKVSDSLTFLAEVLLDHAVEVAWYQMVERHGRPINDENEEVPDLRFTVIGYGKLGGLEMGYTSDLDLVFVHDCPLQKMTRGAKPIDNSTFYTRMAKKVIHLLGTRTASGELYEVDMRLRPSGNSGMMVTTLAALEKYQMKEAWVWEHQALVRARAVAGDGELAQQFMQMRQRVLAVSRDTTSLAQEVMKMRAKMVDHLGSAKEGQFDIKHDPGGIVDIEFMVQFWALAWADHHKSLIEYTDNIRILEAIKQLSLLSDQQVQQLVDAYKAYRSIGHRRALAKQSGTVDAAQFSNHISQVTALWQQKLATLADNKK